MPELPEVEITARGLYASFVGVPITQVVVHNRHLRKPITDDFAATIQGQRCQQITRRGKYLLLHFVHGTVIWHLGMSGSLRFVQKGTPRKKHDHVQFFLASGVVLCYHDPRRFGFVEYTTLSPKNVAYLAKLGPEPLEEDFHPQWLYTMAKKRRISVKQFIMDPQVVVGVGNIYASEALFAARIHPKVPASSLYYTQMCALVDAIQTSLRNAIDAGGSTLRDFINPNTQPGYFQHQWKVYRRKGQPCTRCDCDIQSAVIGQRNTFWCDSCQASEYKKSSDG